MSIGKIKYFSFKIINSIMINTCRQQGSNPATLNPVGIADPDSYTVCGGMTTGDLEQWGNEDEDS